MKKLTPHIFGIVHRLERQLSEIARFEQKTTLPFEKREYLNIHYPQIRRTLGYLRRQAILMQLATARRDRVAEHRQVQIFYGVLELLRPEIHTALQIFRAAESEPSSSTPLRARSAH